MPREPDPKAEQPEQSERHHMDRRKEKTGYTPEQLQDKCLQYLRDCDETKHKPTWQGLAGYLDVTSGTLNEWLSGARGAHGAGLSQVLKKTADAISDRLQQRTDSMAMISVKQPLYGGFTDKPVQQDAAISIRVSFGKGAQRDSREYGD